MHAGRHGNYVWEISNGELIISSTRAQTGELLRQPVGNQFNNAEQATWFAQGQIDMQTDVLAALEADKQA